MSEMRYCRDIMNTDVVSMSQGKTVYDAAVQMAAKNISCIVITERKKPIGILTERDLLRKVVAKDKSAKDLALKEIMTKNPVTVKPETSIVDAARMMKKNKFRRFPIIEKGVLVGIITETDILMGMNDMVRHLNWKLVNTKMAMEEFMDELTSLVL